jgi:RHH-type rel operon transcriptional repressor/antitoxin RelB
VGQPTTIRFEDDVMARLDAVAHALGRSRTWVIKDAVQRYLEQEEWFLLQVQAGLQALQHGQVASRDAVRTCFAQWGVDVS